MWQNKAITFLGAPMSFGQNSDRMIFHTSISLYIGMIGSLLTRFSPLGPILPNIILTLISIPIFYQLTKFLTEDKSKQRFATMVYAFSPLTISYTRFFWIPNLIIPLSVIYWYLYFKFSASKQFKTWNWLILGVAAGAIFNFHYMAIIALLVTLSLLVYQKKYKSIPSFLLGFVLTLLPLLFFELRNNFYFTKSLLDHLLSGNSVTGATEEPSLILRFPLFFSSILGLRFAELRFPSFEFSSIWQYIFGGFIIFRYLTKSLDWAKDKLLKPLFWLSLGIFIIYAFGAISIHIRYLFALYPILICLLADMLYLNNRFVLNFVIIIAILCLGLTRISWTQELTIFTFPLHTLQKIGSTITNDKFGGSYNITENVTGDAQAIAIRYFVERDAAKKPQSKLDYTNLDALYVIAANVGEIASGNRWEYTATPNLVVSQIWNIEPGINLYRFTRP